MTQTPDFDALYAGDQDPWRVETSWYEQRKLGLVCASLRRTSYESAWDPACGTGHLARRLAARSARVRATDGSPRAVRIAGRTCLDVENIELGVNVLPAVPTGAADFDLVILAEFLYYLPEPQRSQTLTVVEGLAAPRSEVVSVHWRHLPHDAYLSGEACQEQVIAHFTGSGWTHVTHHRDEDFMIDSLVRRRRDAGA